MNDVSHSNEYNAEALRARASQSTPKIEFYASNIKMYAMVVVMMFFLVGMAVVDG